MRNHLKKILYLLVLLGFSFARAGSYEDWFRAVELDTPSTVTSLLQRGFDPNSVNPRGEHALYIALREGALKVADVLIRWPKTNVDWENAQGETPLMMAALRGHLDQAKALIERDAAVNKVGWTPLHYAATKGDPQLIALLLEHHAFIDAESPNKTTPLMMAAHYGTAAAVKLLLAEGADPSLRNQLGLNAIDFANRASRQEAADLIAASIRSAGPKGKW
jgi:ankyrin repeat protein